MKTYRATRRYGQGYDVIFREGDEVDLTEADAAVYNGDSPGLLVEVVEEEDPPTRQAGPSPKNRMLTRAPKTREAPREESAPQEEVDATSAAERLAAEHGIDLTLVEGTGVDGRVLKSDVEALV